MEAHPLFIHNERRYCLHHGLIPNQYPDWLLPHEPISLLFDFICLCLCVSVLHCLATYLYIPNLVPLYSLVLFS